MSCPFMELDRYQCKRNLTLANLEKALSLCANDYVSCPMFLELYKRDNAKTARFIRDTLTKPVRKTA